MEVAIFDVASGTFTLPAKVPGGWQSVDMNCCSGWERSTFVRWVSAADARQMLHEASSALRHGAETVVVDEWNEVVSVHGQGLIE